MLITSSLNNNQFYKIDRWSNSAVGYNDTYVPVSYPTGSTITNWPVYDTTGQVNISGSTTLGFENAELYDVEYDELEDATSWSYAFTIKSLEDGYIINLPPFLSAEPSIELYSNNIDLAVYNNELLLLRRNDRDDDDCIYEKIGDWEYNKWYIITLSHNIGTTEIYATLSDKTTTISQLTISSIFNAVNTILIVPDLDVTDMSIKESIGVKRYIQGGELSTLINYLRKKI